MTAANYMTKVDTESIWDTVLDTTRFGNIGVRMAEFCNFKINRDATEQITSGAYTPILEQFCEEVLLLLIAASKIEQLHDPWSYIQSNTMRFLKAHYNLYKEEFDEIRIALEKQHIIKFSQRLPLPSHSDFPSS